MEATQKPGRKKKHVSDTASMGYAPSYNPYTSSAPPMYDDRGGGAPMAPPYGYVPDNSHGMYTQANQGFPIPSQLLNEPLVANVAMQYGQALVGSGKQLVDRELEKYVPVSRLKYYFAVDTGYVTKKLGLILFPFTHSDWSVKYEQDEPVQPRYEINAPDLYIPTMAYLTYVLVAGLVLGTQNRFSPEMLGIHASSALAWLVVEVLVELVTLYVTNIQSSLKTLDLVAYGGYKYVGIILAVLLNLVFQKTGYYIGLIYCGISLAFFLVRTLKVQVLPESHSVHQHDPYGGGSISTGNKRRLYFLLFVAGIQPLLMWWLSAHLISPKT
ncbi:protein YIF1B isoform X2 [Anabrus simplex]|uniref:protein YIF1B isoform X2 n=1 Tax=Anabrus simplex TaxID=316456 RepID=UPI0034DDB388